MGCAGSRFEELPVLGGDSQILSILQYIQYSIIQYNTVEYVQYCTARVLT